MAKPIGMASALLLAAGPLLASCAPAGSADAGAAALTPKQAEILQKHLGGKVAGELVRCLPNFRTNETIRVSDNILLYRSGSTVYRNELRGACPGLARSGDIMVIRQYGSSTCSGDVFHLVDHSSGIRGPTCMLGDFVPYRKAAKDGG